MTTAVLAPAAAAAPTAAVGAMSPQLGQLVGQVINGLVTALIDDTTLRLQTAAGTLDAKVATPLPAGTAVAITIQGTPRQPEIVITPIRPDSGQASTDVAKAAPQSGNANNVQVQPRAQPGSPTVEAAPTETSAADAAASGTTRTATPSPAVQPETANEPMVANTPPPQAALAAAASIIRDAATAQGGLAALYADLESMLAQPDTAAPPPVLDAARQLVAVRFPVGTGATISADAIKTALLRSGTVTMPTASTAAAAGASPADIGTLLVVLRRALQSWIDTEPEMKAAVEQQPSQASPARASPASSAPASSASPAPASSAPRSAAAPMPPYRGAPTVAQAPSAPSLPAGATPRAQAAHLLGQTDAAIARQTLLRVASLPAEQSGSGNAPHGDAAAARMMFDIPVATPQGTGVAQMTIERDDGGNGKRQNTDAAWRATFSIDLEPIGPVHVHVTLAGVRAAVTLNAERPDSAARLAAGLPRLEAGLRGVDLEPGELRCNSGAPRTPAAAPGTFVDQAS